MSPPVGGFNSLDDSTALRRCMLAVSVIHEVDMIPTDEGIVLLGVPDIPVSFAEIAAAIGAIDPVGAGRAQPPPPVAASPACGSRQVVGRTRRNHPAGCVAGRA